MNQPKRRGRPPSVKSTVAQFVDEPPEEKFEENEYVDKSIYRGLASASTISGTVLELSDMYTMPDQCGTHSCTGVGCLCGFGAHAHHLNSDDNFIGIGIGSLVKLPMTWPELAQYVRDNGKTIVRACHPHPPFSHANVIDTIYAGVPVAIGPCSVMDNTGKWSLL